MSLSMETEANGNDTEKEGKQVVKVGARRDQKMERVSCSTEHRKMSAKKSHDSPILKEKER